MSNVSPKLNLPFLSPSQAQKHVTHNEALRLLDGITQLTVKAFNATTPPGVAVDGEAYALAAIPTGTWAGHPGALALWNETAWIFINPIEGWRAWGEAEAELRVYTAGGWQAVVPELQNLESLGINATADLVNRLSITADASLFNNDGTGHQIKINKAGSGDTASMLFQSNWNGHAEVGLTGDNDFHFKVSPNGSTWHDAITVDNNTGRMAITGVSGRIEVFDTGGSVFLGEEAGINDDLSGNDNAFVGVRAGQYTTTGSRNAALGYYALQSNVTGSYGAAMGAYALQGNTTGTRNTAVGYGALQYNTTGGSNSGIGRLTLRNNTTGNQNTAQGVTALYDMNGGAGNTAVGYNTGRGIVTGSANTIIGAGVTGLASGLSNTVILADGAGNQRISFDNTGVMDYKQTPNAATANPTFSHYITLKLNGATYYVPAHNATF